MHNTDGNTVILDYDDVRWCVRPYIKCNVIVRILQKYIYKVKMDKQTRIIQMGTYEANKLKGTRDALT
jgi:hypothetical protein